MNTFQHPVVIGLVVFALAFGATAYRLDFAPDLSTDEIIYTRLSNRRPRNIWSRPIRVHPPILAYAPALVWWALLSHRSSSPPGPGRRIA